MSAIKMSLCALACVAGSAGAAVVNNPSFETGTASPGGPINTNWSYDNHSFVTAENGITPAAGNRMLRFRNTSSVAAAGSGVVCDVFQIIDLTSPADQAIIGAGGASITVSALFNRVMDTPAPNIIDNRFDVRLYATTTYANAQSLTNIGSNSNTLFSDSNLASWEINSCTLNLPTTTQYVTLLLAAVENVLNETSGPTEFFGHYADDVQVRLVPAPGALALIGAGGLLALRRRR